MRSDGSVVRNERGVAMIVAMLILFVIGVLAAMLTMTSVTHSRLSGVEQRRAKALDLAEAGISEAVARIKSGEVPGVGLTNNPNMVAQIYTVGAGSVPVLGADSTGLATAQPAGEWLNYSLPGRGSAALTIKYKTNGTDIYRYDPAKNPPIQTGSGYTIYEITSTGRVGTTVRRVVTDVVPTPINVNVKGALASGVGVKFVGGAQACGFNHRVDTPNNTGVTGRAGAGGCNESVDHWETGADNLTGIWSGGNIIGGGASTAAGTPPKAETQPGFYAGPWEALGMTQAQFYAWIGARQATVPVNLDAITYLDNNSVAQDGSGDFTVHGTGSGMLYVDGDLTVNAGFTYRGLLYVEGNLKLNGNAWILGGLIVKGLTETKFTGGATVLYSAEAITQNLAHYGGSYANLSWREVKNTP